jgi:hypothetical protein
MIARILGNDGIQQTKKPCELMLRGACVTPDKYLHRAKKIRLSVLGGFIRVDAMTIPTTASAST